MVPGYTSAYICILMYRDFVVRPWYIQPLVCDTCYFSILDFFFCLGGGGAGEERRGHRGAVQRGHWYYSFMRP